MTAEGTPIDLEKLRSLHYGQVHGEHKTTEGREHPETGVPFKTVITEAGRVTEHATSDDRVDAVVTPETATRGS